MKSSHPLSSWLKPKRFPTRLRGQSAVATVRSADEKRVKDENLRAVVVAIDSEVGRQWADHVRSAGALTNRSALLVTSALIFVSIPKEGDGSGCWYQLALVCGVLAAILGVGALFFRSKAPAARVDRLEAQLVGKSEVEAIRALTASKRTTLIQDRKRVQITARITLAGFVLLAVSLLCTVVYLLTGN